MKLGTFKLNLESLIRPNIKTLKPYRSARHDFSAGILLDANENSLGSVLSIDGIPLNRYPDPFQLQLRTRLAEGLEAHKRAVTIRLS